MKTKYITLSLAIAITGAGLFSSCKKKDKEEKDNDTASAVDQSLASSTVNDMTNIADEAGRTYTVSSFRTQDAEGITSSCATITIDTLAAAKTITVNFGTTNCMGNDGRNRRGTLILNFTGQPGYRNKNDHK